MKLSELSSKDVIHEQDGAKLGKIVDVEVDIATGRILNVNIHRGFRFMNLFTNKDVLQIPWQKIVKVGNDVIIVETEHKRVKEKED